MQFSLKLSDEFTHTHKSLKATAIQGDRYVKEVAVLAVAILGLFPPSSATAGYEETSDGDK